MTKKPLLLLRGGTSSEHDVSLNSGRMIDEALDRKKYGVVVATIAKDGAWSFGEHPAQYSTAEALVYIRKEHFDVAFIALHGAFGEDGRIQALFDAIELPYTGSGVEASSLAMNKAVSGVLFREAGLRVPDSAHIHSASEVGDAVISFPCVVKPCHGGSSVGVTIAHNKGELQVAAAAIFTSGDTAIVQQQIMGREFTCGVLDDELGNPGALPPTEIIPQKGGIFDYEAKYVPGASIEVTPPELPMKRIRELQEYALQAHTALGCSGMSRSDFMFSDGIFSILETNTIPGMTGTSLLPQEAKAAGISFSQMLDRIIASALRKKQYD